MFLNVSQLQLRTGTKRTSYPNIDQFHFNRDEPLIFWLEEGVENFEIIFLQRQ